MKLAIFLTTACFVLTNPASAGGYARGEYTTGRAASEQDSVNLCAGYISDRLANSLKAVAQRDANGSCRSGRAARTSGWDIDCVNGYTIVYADFVCR